MVAPAAARKGGGSCGAVGKGREGRERDGKDSQFVWCTRLEQGLPYLWASCASPELCSCLGLACLAFVYA